MRDRLMGFLRIANFAIIKTGVPKEKYSANELK